MNWMKKKKDCPFKIYNTLCKLQISQVYKNKFTYRYDGEDNIAVIYDSCIGEKNCPIINKNWRKV